jgi:hypothetical protein
MSTSKEQHRDEITTADVNPSPLLETVTPPKQENAENKKEDHSFSPSLVLSCFFCSTDGASLAEPNYQFGQC